MPRLYDIRYPKKTDYKLDTQIGYEILRTILCS